MGFETLTRPKPTFNQRTPTPVVPAHRVKRPGAVNREATRDYLDLASPAPVVPVDPWAELRAQANATIKLATPGRIPARVVICRIAALHGLSLEHMFGDRRMPSVSHIRQAAMYAVAVVRPDMSLPTIGAAFGGKDHTTILHGIRSHCARFGLDYPAGIAARRISTGRTEATRALEAEARELRAQGFMHNVIAAQLKISRQYVHTLTSQPVEAV